MDRETDTLLEEVTHLTTLIQNYVSRWAQLMIQKRVSREALPDLLGVEVRAPKMSKFRCCKNWTAIKLHLKQTKIAGTHHGVTTVCACVFFLKTLNSLTHLFQTWLVFL